MLSSVQTFDETNIIGKAGEKIIQSFLPTRDIIFQLNKDGLILHKGIVDTSFLWKYTWEKPFPF